MVVGVIVVSAECVVSVSGVEVSLGGTEIGSVEVEVSLVEVVSVLASATVVLGVALVLETDVIFNVVDPVNLLLVVVVLLVAVVLSVTVSALACLAPTKNRPLKTALERSNRFTNPVDVIFNSPM